jgi:hypothetical protein
LVPLVVAGPKWFVLVPQWIAEPTAELVSECENGEYEQNLQLPEAEVYGTNSSVTLRIRTRATST